MQALSAAATSNMPLTEAEIQPLAGGTTLIDLMKLDVMRPRRSSTSIRSLRSGRRSTCRATICGSGAWRGCPTSPQIPKCSATIP